MGRGSYIGGSTIWRFWGAGEGVPGKSRPPRRRKKTQQETSPVVDMSYGIPLRMKVNKPKKAQPTSSGQATTQESQKGKRSEQPPQTKKLTPEERRAKVKRKRERRKKSRIGNNPYTAPYAGIIRVWKPGEPGRSEGGPEPRR